jgi:multidrug efflux system membrane fusion protein
MTKFSFSFSWLAQRPYIIAAFITLVIILWMASGPSIAEQKTAIQAKEIPQNSTGEKIKAQVKVETRYGTKTHKTIELYGRTEPDRITTLKAEVRGKITKVLAQQGANVVKGQAIVKIALNDLPAQLSRSQALLTQREVEYEGALKLNKKGYQGKVQLAQAFAALESVKSDIQRLRLDIANTLIKAPFDGVLNTRYVEVGDYVDSGDKIAMIADLDPLIIRAHVTEQQIANLSVGQVAEVSLLKGKRVQGKVRYIASVGDDATNTFKIEVAIANSFETHKAQLLAGFSSELSIALEETSAIKISPALLALDEQGNIGVKSVQNTIVQFTPIDIVKSESDGIWLTGLGEKTDIIILGQGFVRAGDKVEAIFASSALKDDKAGITNTEQE